MDYFPIDLYTQAQIRSIESFAIEGGIKPFALMQRAGQAAFMILREYWTLAKKILVVCGAGNNGGDGYVIAKFAKEQGMNVTVLYVGDLTHLTECTKQAYQDCLTSGILIKPFKSEHLIDADVVVDALIGIGLQQTIRSPQLEVINSINQCKLPVLAIDIPSGLEADTGTVLGTAVQADITATFIGLKQGLLTGFAPNHTGKIICSDLDIPLSAFERVKPAAQRITYNDSFHLLPPRSKATHKGDFGHVLAIGGDYGYAGAIRMTGEAALRTGAGLVSVATRPEHAFTITSTRPELISSGISHADDIDNLLDKATVIAIGPGLGQSPWSQQLLEKVLKTDLPLVIDADALNLFSSCHPIKRGNWILTPHPGEAGRLLNSNSKTVQANRFAALSTLNKQYGGVVVLKGAGTLISNNEEEVKLCSDGNPGMSAGGFGDILTGIIAGLVAQKLNLYSAASLGVCLHAKAADLARKDGERGMLALDLLPHLRLLVNPK